MIKPLFLPSPYTTQGKDRIKVYINGIRPEYRNTVDKEGRPAAVNSGWFETLQHVIEPAE